MGSACDAVGFEDDKENAGAAGGGKRGKGSASGGGDGGFGAGPVRVGVDQQLSGHKRGGGDIAIEKQKSFTGSYFQVRSCVRMGVWQCVRLYCRQHGASVDVQRGRWGLLWNHLGSLFRGVSSRRVA